MHLIASKGEILLLQALTSSGYPRSVCPRLFVVRHSGFFASPVKVMGNELLCRNARLSSSQLNAPVGSSMQLQAKVLHWLLDARKVPSGKRYEKELFDPGREAKAKACIRRRERFSDNSTSKKAQRYS